MNLREFQANLWLTELQLDDFAVRGAVIIGEKRALVWDTLSHPRDMYDVADLIGPKPIDTVYSHADWDHCWGTAALNSTMIIAHETCLKRFKEGEVAEKLAAKQAEKVGTWDTVQLMPPKLTFTNMLKVDLGGIEVELHHLPGHTEDCLVAFIPQMGVLLAGDTVETPLPYLNHSSVALLDRWISELERWQNDERVQTVIPSHGEIGDGSIITRTVRYLRDLQEGKSPEIPAEMDDFYVETHAKNLGYLRSK